MSDEGDKKRLLRDVREQIPLTQLELAAKAHVSITTVIDIEAGRRTPNVITAERLAEALGVGVSDIRWPRPGELAPRRSKTQADSGSVEEREPSHGESVGE